MLMYYYVSPTLEDVARLKLKAGEIPYHKNLNCYTWLIFGWSNITLYSIKQDKKKKKEPRTFKKVLPFWTKYSNEEINTKLNLLPWEEITTNNTEENSNEG